MLVMYCQTCQKGTPTYRKWIAHLFSPAHQKKTKIVIKGWSKKQKSRAVLFTEFCKPFQEIQEDEFTKLAWKISEHTIISDLYFNCSKQMCLVLIDEKKGADFIVSTEDITVSGRHSLHKRLAADILPSEWKDLLFRKKKKEGNSTSTETVESKTTTDAPDICTEKKISQNEVTQSISTMVFEESDIGDQSADNSPADDNAGAASSTEKDEKIEFSFPQNTVINVKNDGHTLMKSEDSEAINKEFRYFMEENTLSDDLVKKRKLLASQLENILKEGYKHVKIHNFEEGLENLNFLKTTCIALCADVNDHFSQHDSSESVNIDGKDMLKIRRLLCSARFNGSSYCVNLHRDIFQRGFALNFTHKETKIEVQCFFYMKMMAKKLHIVSELLKCDPRVPLLTAFLVAWYEKCAEDLRDELSELPNKFYGHYSFIQLIIFFLIHKGVLSNMNLDEFFQKEKVNISITETRTKVMKNFKQSCIYSANDVDPVTKEPSAKCILTLAKEFFQYFAAIDFKKYIISLTRGKLINKVLLLTPKTKKANNLGELPEFYRQWTSTYETASFIVQDMCDQHLYDFCKHWSSESLSEFQSTCKSTSLVIENILYSEVPSFSILWNFFPKEKPNQRATISYGFISKSDMVTKTTTFTIRSNPRVLKYATQYCNKKFLFLVLVKFFQVLVKDVLKFELLPESQIKHCTQTNLKLIGNKRKSGSISEENMPPSKKLKADVGSTFSVKEAVAKRLDKLLSKLGVTYQEIYTQTYLIEHRYSKILSPQLREQFKSKVLPPQSENPLMLEKQISDHFKDDEDNSTEMTFKIFLDFKNLFGGMHIEAPCDEQGLNISRLREMLDFTVPLVDKYVLYRIDKFLKKHKKPVQQLNNPNQNTAS